MIMAIAAEEQEEGGTLVIGLEAADLAMMLEDDDAFSVPLGEVGAPMLREWTVQILGPISTARLRAERNDGGQNGHI